MDFFKRDIEVVKFTPRDKKYQQIVNEIEKGRKMLCSLLIDLFHCIRLDAAATSVYEDSLEKLKSSRKRVLDADFDTSHNSLPNMFGDIHRAYANMFKAFKEMVRHVLDNDITEETRKESEELFDALKSMRNNFEFSENAISLKHDVDSCLEFESSLLESNEKEKSHKHYDNLGSAILDQIDQVCKKILGFLGKLPNKDKVKLYTIIMREFGTFGSLLFNELDNSDKARERMAEKASNSKLFRYCFGGKLERLERLEIKTRVRMISRSLNSLISNHPYNDDNSIIYFKVPKCSLNVNADEFFTFEPFVESQFNNLSKAKNSTKGEKLRTNSTHDKVTLKVADYMEHGLINICSPDKIAGDDGNHIYLYVKKGCNEITSQNAYIEHLKYNPKSN